MMQRPYRRLESNKHSSLEAHSSSSVDDLFHTTLAYGESDEESGVKGKTIAHTHVATTALTRNWTAVFLGCCIVLLLFLRLTNFSNTIFAPEIPASLTTYLSENHQFKQYPAPSTPQYSTLFYTSQSVDLRYCNSSVTEDSIRHRVSPSSSDTPSIYSDDEVGVIIYAGESRHGHPGYKNFKTSLDLTGYKNIHVVEPPPSTREINKYTHANHSGEAHFWKERLQHFHDKTLEFPADGILLFCDAFDTLFTQPPSTLLRRFSLFGSDIVFSTEILCDTVSCRKDLWLKDFFVSIAPQSNPYKYINAGIFMGKAFALRAFMLCALSYANNGRDDQTAFSHCFHQFYMSRHNNSMAQATGGTLSSVSAALDYNSLLFGNLPPVSTLFEQTWDFQTSRADAAYEIFEIPFLYRKHSMTTPLTLFPLYYSPIAIHFPGIAYRPSLQEQWFNPCQQFLKWRYNEIGESIFKSGRIPNLAYGFVSKANRQDEALDMTDKGILTGASYTLFDINEVNSRNHQELWLEAYHRGDDAEFEAKWKSLKQEAEIEYKVLSSVTDVSKDTLSHISSSIAVSDKKFVSEKVSSRVSKLLMKKLNKIDLDSPEQRRSLSEIKSDMSIKALFEQKTSFLQPERIVLIETLELGCSVEIVNGERSTLSEDVQRNIILQLSQHLSENLEAIYANNIYWKPDRIVLRIKFSTSMSEIFEDISFRSLEKKILSEVKEMAQYVDGVNVICTMRSHWDSDFLELLQHENSDTVFVMLEKELNFIISESIVHSGNLVRSSEDVHSSLPLSLPLPQLHMDTLLKTFMRTPLYAYGFSGFFAEPKGTSESLSEISYCLRSTNHVVDKAPIPVDVLNLRGGITFQRGMLKSLRNDIDYLTRLVDSADCRCTSESLLISAILSRNSIPRVHIPYEGKFNVNRQMYLSSNNEVYRRHDQTDFSHCLRCLISIFEKDWIDPTKMRSTSQPFYEYSGKHRDVANMSTNVRSVHRENERRNDNTQETPSSCTTPSFQVLPHIDNLPGFSFQYNWDPISATSPCTQHLMTRYEESSGILGVGQFMTENQTMFSPRTSTGSPFMIKLVNGARLCLYKVSWSAGNIMEIKVMTCLLPPIPHTKLDAHYAAVTDGELCFYKGLAPHFGGTKKDSLHQQLAWCTSPTEMNIRTYEEMSGDTSVTMHHSLKYVKSTQNQRLLTHASVSTNAWAMVSNTSTESKRHRQLSRSSNVGEMVKRSFKKRSHDVIMHRVQAKCILKVISPPLFPYTYLHVDVSGTFGLFISPLVPPFEISTPAARIASLRRARCFKKFIKK